MTGFTIMSTDLGLAATTYCGIRVTLAGLEVLGCMASVMFFTMVGFTSTVMSAKQHHPLSTTIRTHSARRKTASSTTRHINATITPEG